MTLVHKLFHRRRSGSVRPQIELLSRDGCHLCDEALAALAREFGARNIDVVDITSNQTLEDEFVFRIPVVLYEGAVVVEGIIGPKEARKAYQQVRRLSHTSGKHQ